MRGRGSCDIRGGHRHPHRTEIPRTESGRKAPLIRLRHLLPARGEKEKSMLPLAGRRKKACSRSRGEGKKHAPACGEKEKACPPLAGRRKKACSLLAARRKKHAPACGAWQCTQAPRGNTVSTRAMNSWNACRYLPRNFAVDASAISPASLIMPSRNWM